MNGHAYFDPSPIPTHPHRGSGDRMKTWRCAMLLLLAACNKQQADDAVTNAAASPPIARIFESSKPQVPPYIASLCLFPTSRYSEHTDSNGHTVQSNKQRICLPGDDVAASLQRYQNSTNVLEFRTEPSPTELVVHSLVRIPISQVTFNVDFSIYLNPNRRADAVANFGSLYIDGQRATSLTDIDAFAAMIRRPDFSGFIVDAASVATQDDADIPVKAMGKSKHLILRVSTSAMSCDAASQPQRHGHS
jgi:hypothetical protein